ncbi:PadR family transcriptional regulator [Heyndrickxia sp. NPDC080065]|uniref:PadR family transcriptional regulator n=1 Tax=Heyndrickxia sp. NPDC080065 TaxID=3390568 RepID=UPI003D065F1F
MTTINHTKYAILGLLTVGCRSGYSIKQMIDGSLNHFWKVSYGQIYPTLKQLVDEGLATVEQTTQDGKPDKKEYNITPKGQIALQEWIQTPLKEIPTEKNELLLKLFFGNHQSDSTIHDHLAQYLQKLLERYNTYDSIEQMIHKNLLDQSGAKFWLITLDYGKRTTQASIEWCENTMKKIKNVQEEKG